MTVTQIPVLDHGYVRAVEHWGSDARIIEAARMSTGGGFKGWGDVGPCGRCGAQQIEPGGECVEGFKHPRGDERLLRYLYEHKHATPFEMAGLVIEVKAPIFVYRQWHRHRTQSYNEMSARYTPLPADDYLPTWERCLVVNGKNKQAGKAKRAGELTHEQAIQWLEDLASWQLAGEEIYQRGLSIGIPKEIARLATSVGRYSVMRASANLRNWLAFMTLRCDSHAQDEIRRYANGVGVFIGERFPRTHGLWVEGVEREASDRLMREFVSELYASVFEDWKEQRA